MNPPTLFQKMRNNRQKHMLFREWLRFATPPVYEWRRDPIQRPAKNGERR